MTLEVADLDNAKIDVDHMADIANSPLPEATDRMGHTKKTIAGLSAEFPAAYDNAQAAEEAAAQAEADRMAAEAAAAQAQAAAGAAMITGNIYPDITTGRAAVADAAQFSAVITQDETGRFTRTSATTQNFITSAPTARLVRALAADAAPGVIDPQADIVPLVVDEAGEVQLGYLVSERRLAGSALERAYGQRGEEGRGRVLPPALFTPIAASANVWIGCLWHGQSNPQGATGQYGSLPVSVAQPYGNRTFAGGPKSDTAPDMASDIPLVERAYAGVDIGYSETPCSGTANYANTWAARNLGRDPATMVFFAFVGGEGGMSLLQISKPGGIYTNFMGQVDAFVARAAAAGKTPIVPAVSIDVGETDYLINTTQATYEAQMIQLRTDLDTDIRAKTGQTLPIHLLITQTSYGARLKPAVVRAQFKLAKTNDYIHLTHATYFLPFEVDGTHRTEWGHRLEGNIQGRSLAQLVVEGRVPDWLEPLSVTAQGTTVRFRFKVPRPPLRFDLNTIQRTDQLGFAVSDAGGVVGLSNIRVVGGVNVEATLARTLGASPEGRYAMDAIAWKLAGGPLTDGASGNLCDSTEDPMTIDGIARLEPHRCPHFAMPITILEA